MRAQLTAQLLGYLGLIPFYAALLAFSLLEDYPRSLAIQGFLIYSLAILSFLGGALWGFARTLPQDAQALRLIVSNGIVIFAVSCLLTGQTTVASASLMLGYLALLWYERRVDSTDGWYPVMRFRLTVGVVVAHIGYAVLMIVGA
jgi:hypothetical protein